MHLLWQIEIRSHIVTVLAGVETELIPVTHPSLRRRYKGQRSHSDEDEERERNSHPNFAVNKIRAKTMSSENTYKGRYLISNLQSLRYLVALSVATHSIDVVVLSFVQRKWLRVNALLRKRPCA